MDLTDGEIVRKLLVMRRWTVLELHQRGGGFEWRGRKGNEPERWYICNPLVEWKDVMEMQAALPEHLRDAYVDALYLGFPEVEEPLRSNRVTWWGFAAATPRQRCLAAIAALEGK